MNRSPISRKRFSTPHAYVLYALGPDAPRYSAVLGHAADKSLARCFNIQRSEALFSDDLVELQKYLVGWLDFDMRVEPYIDRQGARWRLAHDGRLHESLEIACFDSDAPPIGASTSVAEAHALDALFRAAEPTVQILDHGRKQDRAYLTELAEDCGWGHHTAEARGRR